MPDSKIRGNKEARYDTTPRANDLPHRERKRIETEITQIRPDPGSGINLIMSIRDLNRKISLFWLKNTKLLAQDIPVKYLENLDL